MNQVILNKGVIKKSLAFVLAAVLLAVDILPSCAAVDSVEKVVFAEENVKEEESSKEDGTKANEAELLEAKPYSGNIDLQSWLSLLSSDAYISELNLPGTRESLAANIDQRLRTQETGLRGQLKNGARVLDLHLAFEEGTLVGKHSTFTCGTGEEGKPYTFEDAAGQTLSFLKEHPTEFVIMFLKEELGGRETKDEIRKAAEQLVRVNSGKVRLLENGAQVPKLGEVRGQLLLIIDDDLVPDAADGGEDSAENKKRELEAFFKKTKRQQLFASGKTLIANAEETDYPNTAIRILTGVKAQFSLFDPNVPFSETPQGAAEEINPWLIRVFDRAEYRYQRIGWFFCDFLSDKLAEAVIRTNNFVADASLDWWALNGGVLSIYENPVGVYSENNIPWASEKGKITVVNFEKEITPKGSVNGWFSGCSFLKQITGLSRLNLSEVTDASRMFYGCGLLESIEGKPSHTEKVKKTAEIYYGCRALKDGNDLIWDLPAAEDISGMFRGCSGLTEVSLSAVGQKVKQAGFLFADCKGLKKADLSSLGTAPLESMEEMFRNCSSLQEIKGIEKLDVSRVSSMTRLFSECRELNFPSLKDWETGNCTSMDGMFAYSGLSGEVDLSGWKVSRVVSMEEMFAGCSSVTALRLSEWEPYKCQNFQKMFANCGTLKTVDMMGWLFKSTLPAAALKGMFGGCSLLKTILVYPAFSETNEGLRDGSVSMFSNCLNLTGGNGTRYQNGQEDNGLFGADGVDGKKGYLTADAEGIGISILNTEATYDGKEHSIAVKEEYPGKYECKYRDADGKETDTPPVYWNAGTYPVTVEVSKGGVLAERIQTALVIRRKDLTDSDVEIYFLDEHDNRLQEPLQVVPSADSWLGVVTESIRIGEKFLSRKYEYTITGNKQTAPGRYILTITGIKNYTGVIRKEWSYLKNTGDVETHNFSGSYDGKAHSASVSLKEGGIFSGLATEISYSENGTDWQTEPFCYTEGTHFVYYKVEGYSQLFGGGRNTASPDSAEKKEKESVPEENSGDFGVELLAGNGNRTPVETAEGRISVDIWKLELKVSAADMKALPDCEFVYPELKLFGHELAKTAKLKITVGETRLGEDRKLKFTEAGTYRMNAVLEPTAETEELCRNIEFSCAGADVKVLDVWALSGGIHVLRKDELSLEVMGEGAEDGALKFQWQEKKNESSEWKNGTGFWGNTDRRLYGTAESDMDGRQYRCLIRLTGQTPEMTLATEPVTLQVTDVLAKTDVEITGTMQGYDGSPKSLSVKGIGVAAGAEVTFCREKSGEYLAEEITRTDAGSTTVYYCVKKEGYVPYYGSAVLEVIKKTASYKEMHVTIAGISEDSYTKSYTYDGKLHPKLTGEGAELITVIPEDAGEVSIRYGLSSEQYDMTDFPTFRNVRYDEDGDLDGRMVYYRIQTTNYEDKTGELRILIRPKELSSGNLQLLPANCFAYTGEKQSVTPVYCGVPVNTEKGIRMDEETAGATTLSAKEIGTYSVTVKGSGNYRGTVKCTWKIVTAVPEVIGRNVVARYDPAHPEKTYQAEVTVVKPAEAKVSYGRYGYDETGEMTVKWQNTPYAYSTPGVHMDLFLVEDTEEPKRYEDYVGITTVTIGDISAEDVRVPYDRMPHRITVKVNGLSSGEENSDSGFTVLYSTDGKKYSANIPGFTDAGEYTVYYRVSGETTGEEEYAGSAKIVITPAELAAEDVILTPAVRFGYNGKEHTVGVLVKGRIPDGENFRLAEASVLTAADAGVYKVTVEGKKNYTGTVTKTWEITASELPEIRVRDYYGFYDDLPHAASLEFPEELKDATVTYYEDVYDLQAGTNGQAEPFSFEDAGTWTSYYRIEKKSYETQTGVMVVSLGSADIVDHTGSYDGKAHGVTVNLSAELEGNTEVFYAETKDGTYSRKPVTCTEANHSSGGKKVYLRLISSKYGEKAEEAVIDIRPVAFTEGDIQLYPGNVFEYDGTEKEIKIWYQGREVPEGMKVSGSTKATAPGSYRVTVTGDGNYEGSVSRTWKITNQELPGITVENYSGRYDGRPHSAKVTVDGTGYTLKYIHYGFNAVTGNLEMKESSEPFVYTDSGYYADFFTVSKPGCEDYLGVMTVTIIEGALTVRVKDAQKLAGQEDPAYEYEILTEGYELTELKGILFEREKGEGRGSYTVTAKEKEKGLNPEYELSFESGKLDILDVRYRTSPADVQTAAGADAVFRVDGTEEDLEECYYLWEIKKPGSSEWEEIEELADGEEMPYDSELKLPNITKAMDGSKIRCAILVGYTEASDTVSREATLMVGGGKSADDDSDTSTEAPEEFTQNKDGSWSLRKNGMQVRNEWACVEYSFMEAGVLRTAPDWFIFDNEGKMVTGWYKDTKGDWYYLNENRDGRLGRMMTGLIKDSTGKYYYLNTNTDGMLGKMLTGWVKVGGYWYYFIEDSTKAGYGSMLLDGRTPDGRRVDAFGRYLGTDAPGKEN